jgi:hypothetical protein
VAGDAESGAVGGVGAGCRCVQPMHPARHACAALTSCV